MQYSRSSRIVVGLSSILYVASLFLPAFDCGPDGRGFLGYEVLLFGYMGLIALDPRWFANPILFIMLFKLMIGKPGANSTLPFFASALAVTSIFFKAAGCGVGGGAGGGAPGTSAGLAIGGYLWVAIVVFTSVSYAVIGEANLRAERRERTARGQVLNSIIFGGFAQALVCR